MIIHLESTEAAFERMKSLFDSGQVTEIDGLKILNVSKSGARAQSKNIETSPDPSRRAASFRIPIVKDSKQQSFLVSRSFAFLLAFLATVAAFAVFLVTSIGESLNSRIYFLVLVLVGLLCALFFGEAIHGYASAHQKHFTTGAALSGPAAVFILILLAGINFAPNTPSTFDLTVRAYESDGKTPILKSGTIILDLGNDRRQAEMGANGEANFKGIPAHQRGRLATVLARVNGYKEESQIVKLSGNALYISLTPVRNQDTDSKDAVLIKNLIASEADLVLSNSRDETSAEKYGALFAADALIADSGPPARIWHGRKEIMARFRKLERFAELRHILTKGPEIGTDNSSTAEAITEFLIDSLTPNQNPNGSGKERWTFIKEGDQWKIRSFRYNVP